MSADYSNLAEAYDTYRIGYSADLYAALTEFGLQGGSKVLDVACGTGLASEPLIKSGARVTGLDQSGEMLEYAKRNFPQSEWLQGTAEKLPFEDAAFDAAICAQAFHWFDRAQAMNEIVRVVRPGGLVAIWWKHLMSDDPVRKMRDEVAQTLGATLPASGLTGGFLEFYRAPLSEHTLRVIPWRLSLSIERYLGSERSRRNLRDTLGQKFDVYLTALREKLTERYGSQDTMLSLGYLQFLYLGKPL